MRCALISGLCLLAGCSPNQWFLPGTGDGGAAADAVSAPDAGGLDFADTGAAPTRDAGSPTALHCDEVDAFVPVHAPVIETWRRQDDRWPGPASPLVFVGSSSIRRWEGLARAYADYSPLQRGFGGAQLGEVAHYAQDLIIRHDPRAVVVYAGTNDLAAGVSRTIAVERLRCLRERVALTLGPDRPVIFIGVTPTPARWAQWPEAAAFNAAIAELASRDPGLFYVDVASVFLRTGSPPAAHLFAPDQLHLSDAGYALWDSAIHPIVAGAALATPPGGSPQPPLPAGARIRVDMGPNDGVDGEPTPSPDYMGHDWNNWSDLDGSGEILPGERLGGLITTAGAPTGLELVVTGGFRAAGFRAGGLRWPDAERLGDLAVGSATGDFVYSTDDDRTGGLYLRGLDPNRRYTLRLFGARNDNRRRVTRYAVSGATSTRADLQTSGTGAGASGSVNDDEIAQLSGIQPDAWGHIFIDLQPLEGGDAYLSLVELVVESAAAPHRPAAAERAGTSAERTSTSSRRRRGVVRADGP